MYLYLGGRRRKHKSKKHYNSKLFREDEQTEEDEGADKIIKDHISFTIDEEKGKCLYTANI